MKLLWLCNGPSTAIAESLGNKGGIGWIDGALNALREYFKEKFEIAICFPSSDIDGITEEIVGNTCYYMFPASPKSPHRYEKKNEIYLDKIYQRANPDIVHIWGTEYGHSLAMCKVVGESKKILINVQGLCSIIEKHYCLNLPTHIVNRFTVRDLLKYDSIRNQKKKFGLRGKNECAAIRKGGYAIGRTDWDRACIEEINPNITYYHCNETLRECFYNKKWQFDNCERYSIFVSRAYSPIKGLHTLLLALPEVKKFYPDVKVYVADKDLFAVPIYRIDSYSKYLKELILSNNLKSNIVFSGQLTADEMLERYMRSNVFVLSSSIENSSNSLGEAMMIGMPIIAADVGGVNCFIKHKQNGYLYQSDAPYMLAYYLKCVFRNIKDAAFCGEKAKSDAAILFNRKINAHALYDIYQRVEEMIK